MKWLCATILLLSLAACGDIVDGLYRANHPHHRHTVRKQYVPPPEEEPPRARAETHEEKVERVHREAAQRRQRYCDDHPNLAIRIGC